MSEDRYPWWASLKHGGMLIAPSRLGDYFEEQPPPLEYWQEDHLRRDVTRLDGGGTDAQARFLTTTLEEICGLDGHSVGRWTRGNDVAPKWSQRALTGEIVKPRRVWEGPNGAVLPVFVDNEKRLGIGRGKKSVSQVVHWLRAADQKIALVTNGRQFRLIYAGIDFDAWAEWDADLWFEEGKPGLQVDAIRLLISPETLTPPEEDEPSPLLAAILDSRKGEAELSQVLGERVREAVEILVQAHAPALERIKDDISPEDIYRAATRIVMRMVVALFAEGRELLPRENPVYYDSYSLDGLREELTRHEGRDVAQRLGERYGAWPRILALFRLIYHGSPHERLPILRYGGGLFRPGNPEADDHVQRAVATFESPDDAPSDWVVRQILKKLCTTKVKIRQGRQNKLIDAPVDFSDLSSEYIGILYEGLLDFELRQVQLDQPMVFLELGDQPALPLERLEGMSDSELENLVDKLKVRKRRVTEGDGDEDEDAEEDELEDEELEDEEEEEEEEIVVEKDADEEESEEDPHFAVRQRAVEWAKRAVAAGKVVGKPRGRMTAEKKQAYDEEVAKAADRIVNRVILPGEWYLVRWGGTRKGAGTFYTRPQLAVPTVQRTLVPLTSEPPVEDGEPNTDAPPALWTPKEPRAIVELKVCDPAMGSGSFLVAALRHLTDTLYASLLDHEWLVPKGDGLALGNPPDPVPDWLMECIKDFPLENQDYETYVRARLRRIVCERCLYGVDLDPVAVELGRLALWVETMDRDLPFEFLDHKLKCGNSLIGCWFDRFRDYPLMAWERDGGDQKHTRGVHHEKNEWHRALRNIRNNALKSQMAAWIGGQELLPDLGGRHPEEVHDQAEEVYETLHAADFTETDQKEHLYHEEFEENEDLRRLRQAFDCWCAVWFWPPDELADVPMPSMFADPPEETRKVVDELRNDPRLRFFHWELEFPDVFREVGDGFDAIVGNPPWETLQPSSKEYFSNVDPLYRAYGKQEALRKQTEYFESDPSVEHDWLDYCAYYRAMSNWHKVVAGPFGDGEAGVDTFSIVQGRKNNPVLEKWRRRRENRHGYVQDGHPFRHQGGGKAYTYKMFLELGHFILAYGGRLGFIVPSNVYTDQGSTALRDLFLDECQWDWLFGFENRNGIFAIHRSFKFCSLILWKGGQTDAIRTSFMHRDLDDWAEAERYAIPYGREQVAEFSPDSRAFLEFQDPDDFNIMKRIYASSVRMGEQEPRAWSIQYSQGDFNITSDADVLSAREWWEESGYEADQYGRWVDSDGRVALPLLEGRMIGPFRTNAKGWVSGRGRSAVWEDIPLSDEVRRPQFLALRDVITNVNPSPETGRVVIKRITSATNKRTCIGGLANLIAAEANTPLIKPMKSAWRLPLLAVLNSFVHDWTLRFRAGGLTLDWHYLEQQPLPDTATALEIDVVKVASLSCAAVRYAAEWLRLREAVPQIDQYPWKRLWASTQHERLRLRCAVDAMAAELYHLEWADLAWILRESDHPKAVIYDDTFSRSLDQKGFWRVDKEKDPELRHTVLSLVAFHALKETIASHGGDREAGIAAFCNQNDGEGWMLPETLRLADYGLGHDDRADRPQPVRERLGERFLPWQLEQSVEESWEECEQHARNILGESGYRRLMAEINGEATPENSNDDDSEKSDPDSNDGSAAPGRPTDLFGRPLQQDLFGNTIYPDGKKRK